MNFKPVGFFKMTKDVKTSATLSKKETEFLKIFLEKIKNEKSLSENQKRILELNSNENRTDNESKTLKILLKAEKIVFDEKIENEKLQSKINEDILKTIKKLLISKIEVRDLFLGYVLENKFKHNDLIKQYVESLPKIENGKSVAVTSVDSGNEKSDSIIENQNEAVEIKNDSDIASPQVAQTYSFENADIVPDDN
mgnify:CR=1 FL=1